MNNDTVVGIVGALALVAVMVGVFVYEYNNEVETADTEDYVSTTASGPQAEATTNVGGESMETIELNQTYITNVTFTLTWTHQAAPDTLKFSVTGPDGVATATSQEEDDGSISLKVAVPDGAEDEDLGMGQWNITVEFVSAEQTNDGLPGGIDNPATDPESDSSVSWTVATRVEHLAPPTDA